MLFQYVFAPKYWQKRMGLCKQKTYILKCFKKQQSAWP